MDAKSLVDYAASLDCIHCGLCLRTCPTYRLTGAESSSPRGRIHLMRAVAEGRLDAHAPAYGEELDFCLVCRHCESVCPAGVRFGEMMEHARDALERERPRPLLERWVRFVGFERVLVRRGALQLAFGALRLAQRTGLARLLPRRLGLAALPSVPPARERRLLPAVTHADGERRGAVALLEGCVMPALYGRVQRAAAGVLAAAGWDVRTATGHVCCGALHAHNGRLEGARREARDTIARFERLTDESGVPLTLVNASAGCGAHLKAYGTLLADDPDWAERARAFAARVADFSEFLARAPEALNGRLRAPADAGTLAYDDPCHLCHGQGVRRAPRDLLDLVAGLRRVELEDSESCCGSAGIYSLLRPADSAAIFEEKRAALERSGAHTLVTANPGCHLQWQAGLARAGSSVRVAHVAEVLAEALAPARGLAERRGVVDARERGE